MAINESLVGENFEVLRRVLKAAIMSTEVEYEQINCCVETFPDIKLWHLNESDIDTIKSFQIHQPYNVAKPIRNDALVKAGIFYHKTYRLSILQEEYVIRFKLIDSSTDHKTIPEKVLKLRIQSIPARVLEENHNNSSVLSEQWLQENTERIENDKCIIV